MDKLDKDLINQYQKLSGTGWKPEVRKLPLMQIDAPNFESVTVEKLEQLSKSGKVPKLQSYSHWHNFLTRIELNFSNEFDSAVYQTTSYASSHPKYDQKWDASRKIKKVSVLFHTSGYIYGMKLLDENDNEIDKWDRSGGNSDYTWETTIIDDGFEIIGIYGDSRKDLTHPQFGFLIWNPSV